MDEHHIIEWVGVITLFLFGMTMICQGHFIYHGKNGYSRKDYHDQDKRDQIRRQIEKVIRGK